MDGACTGRARPVDLNDHDLNDHDVNDNGLSSPDLNRPDLPSHRLLPGPGGHDRPRRGEADHGSCSEGQHLRDRQPVRDVLDRHRRPHHVVDDNDDLDNVHDDHYDSSAHVDHLDTKG
jgi:hypothetical protein